MSLLPNLQGRIAIGAAYVLFAYMYGLTLVYGIWAVHERKENIDIDGAQTFWAVLSTIIFTFFFSMMIWAHVVTVFTSPGHLPRDYEKLHEENLPKDFYNLINLRESLYAEVVVKKKMRKGELTKESIPNFDEVLRLSRSRRSIGASLATSPKGGASLA